MHFRVVDDEKAMAELLKRGSKKRVLETVLVNSAYRQLASSASHGTILALLKPVGCNRGHFRPTALPRHHTKDRGCRDRRHFPFGIFFPFRLKYGCLFSRIIDY